MDNKEKIHQWMFDDYFDKETQLETKLLSKQQMEEQFSKELSFGTGGLRALMGVGTNRLNRYTVRRITYGYGNYLKNKKNNNKVVIAYDTRINSKEFAEEVAITLENLGITALLCKNVSPTPFLSYLIREMNADGGVVITASHNTPEYNGYKIYNNKGCQVTLTEANEIINEINKILDYTTMHITSEIEIKYIPDDLENSFIDDAIKNIDKANINNNIQVLYTPLHGTGAYIVPKLFEKLGITSYHLVNEQLILDGKFSTVTSPNPENSSSFSLALEIANNQKKKPDIILGTDPDSDRVGILVLHDHHYNRINGNQIGALMLNYLIETRNITSDNYICKTIVTSDLGKEIASKNNITTYETLTGFKFIGELMDQVSGKFLMGYEESFGYLTNDYIRDKDAISSIALILEMVSFYKNKNLDLIQVLNQLYEEYGYFEEKLVTVNLEDTDIDTETLIEHISKLNQKVKQQFNISCIKDYRNGIDKLPKSNVIKLIFNDLSWIAIRPSGTEPKVKYYLSSRGNHIQELERIMSELLTIVGEKL